jgi:predicted nucleic acid-binding protein
MIFVDSNVFIYAVGRPHPFKAEGQTFDRNLGAAFTTRMQM